MDSVEVKKTRLVCDSCGASLDYDGKSNIVVCKACNERWIIALSKSQDNKPNEDKKEAEELLRICGYRDICVEKLMEQMKKCKDIFNELDFSENVLYCYENNNDKEKPGLITKKKCGNYYYGYHHEDYNYLLADMIIPSVMFADGKNPYNKYYEEWSKNNNFNYEEQKKQLAYVETKKDDAKTRLDKFNNGLSIIPPFGKKRNAIYDEWDQLDNAYQDLRKLVSDAEYIKGKAEYYESLSAEDKETVYNYLSYFEKFDKLNDYVTELLEIADECLTKAKAKTIYDLNFNVMADVRKIERYQEIKNNIYPMIENLGITLVDADKEQLQSNPTFV